MSVNAVTHLNFRGEARAALMFYHAVFGGHLAIATYADFGAPTELPSSDLVVWGQVAAASGFRVMAYDVPAPEPNPPAAPATRREHGMTLTQDRFFISLRGESADEIAALWAGLSKGATIIEPLASAQWAQLFGMLTDQFGVTWILDVEAAQES